MECKRCKKEIEDWDTHRRHIPICSLCRMKMLRNNEFDLTEEEKRIMNERLETLGS
jgi:predicted amidophosphoribosyltransferase